MPRRHIHVTGAAEDLRAALRALRTRMDVPAGFPPAVLAEAEAAAASPRLPDHDATDIPLFTIDPPGSRDLDQAIHLARRPGGGYRVHYAIADVAAFVTPGGAVDKEAHRRVETLYFPDEKIPLHPPVLSEGAASLLPDHTAPALLWRFDLDADGAQVAVDVRRARVRSRLRLDYAGAQQLIDAGTAEEPLALLKTVGTLREALEVERGGVSLNLPDQEVVQTGDSYTLVYHAPNAVDGWNEQISLLAGMAAADLMIGAGIGILRTLGAAQDGVEKLRRSAKALEIDWPHHMSYAELIRSLDPAVPRHAAFLLDATGLFRKAAYIHFKDGTLPDPHVHSAIADEYTSCTAPLRRLVDRYVGELCLAAVDGQAPPAWVKDALTNLPADMDKGRGKEVDRESMNVVEAALLKDRVGQVFDGFVIDVRDSTKKNGVVHLKDPAVVGTVKSPQGLLEEGTRVKAKLTKAEPAAPDRDKVLFKHVPE
ncbi:ribonuclease catalytic domain-containing protein [Streptomyces vilmorinianum]|uniref:ribonuclease catalytic domain-containing protein n=1 Tax=Streptomyces vilmorinianum TaxID=3051092 RepID=UPI0010FBA0A5|nr:RNB domain-containing ribonuclease [Streptomyces vilmorinianum]